MKRLHLRLLFSLTAPGLKAERPFKTIWLTSGNFFTIPAADGRYHGTVMWLENTINPLNSGMQPYALPVMEDQRDAGVVPSKNRVCQ